MMVEGEGDSSAPEDRVLEFHLGLNHIAMLINGLGYLESGERRYYQKPDRRFYEMQTRALPGICIRIYQLLSVVKSFILQRSKTYLLPNPKTTFFGFRRFFISGVAFSKYLSGLKELASGYKFSSWSIALHYPITYKGQ